MTLESERLPDPCGDFIPTDAGFCGACGWEPEDHEEFSFNPSMQGESLGNPDGPDEETPMLISVPDRLAGIEERLGRLDATLDRIENHLATWQLELQRARHFGPYVSEPWPQDQAE